MIRTRDIEWDQLGSPSLVQWTYGTGWSKARLWRAGTDSEEVQQWPNELQSPSVELCSETDEGVTFLGCRMVDWPAASVRALMRLFYELADGVGGFRPAIQRIEAVHGRRVKFSLIQIGVFNRWEECPSRTLAIPRRSGGQQVESHIHELFPTGVDGRVAIEIMDPDLQAWLGVTVSEHRTPEGHAVSLTALNQALLTLGVVGV